IIVGPEGPLGGVDITITDGVLDFATKTSSEPGSVGRWSMSGLSTPNTYTLTAAMRGYGTEVQQITLGPGEQRNGLSVTMHAGVAAVSGLIT
ncbi:MAG TPA: carboxypeptidase regulatory-like domain-containing protein, partial [Ilumatobacteraceae bacterium]|nr:carboxypeptidase regulatory-like domain-containing protein [Ilumatobacteraceae bacterium]